MRGGFGVKEGGHRLELCDTLSGLNKPLMNWLLFPYRKGRQLDIRGHLGPSVIDSVRRIGGRKGESS